MYVVVVVINEDNDGDDEGGCCDLGKDRDNARDRHSVCWGAHALTPAGAWAARWGGEHCSAGFYLLKN